MNSLPPRLMALVLCITVVGAGCAASSPPNTAIPPVVDSQLIADLVGDRNDAGGGGHSGGVMGFAWSDGRWIHAELSYVDQDIDEFVKPPSGADLSMGDTMEVAGKVMASSCWQSAHHCWSTRPSTASG